MRFSEHGIANSGTFHCSFLTKLGYGIGGILADVIVYIFAHLHTALLAEGNTLDIN